MTTAMQPQVDRLDVAARARAKDVSRLADARAMSSGQKSASQLRRENEVFALLAAGARVNFSASRRLG
jgi:hypothetical protein